MQHTGQLYIGKGRPVAETSADGVFRLTLALIDNLGDGTKERYRVRWSGPQARDFWAAHGDALLPGAVLRAHLTHLHQYAGSAWPHTAELHARVVDLALVAPVPQPAPAA